MKNKQLRKALSFQQMVAIGLVISLALVLSAVAVFDYFSHVDERDTQKNFLAIASAKQAQIVRFIWERQRDAQILSTRPELLEAIQSRGPLNQNLREMLDAVLKQTQDSYRYHDVRLVNLAFDSVGSVDGDPLQELEIKAFREAIKTRSEVLVGAHLSTRSSVPCFGVAYPVFVDGDRTKPVIGVVYLETDIERELYPIVSTWPFESESAESLLFRRDGKQIEYLTPLRYEPTAAPFSVKRPLAKKLVAALGTESSDPVIVKGTDYRGVDVLAAVIPVTGTDWFLEVKEDTAEVSRALRALGNAIAAIVIALLVVLGYGIRLLWRTSSAEHEASRLALNARISAASEASIDGYVVLDQTGQILDVNESLCRMTGYAREELLGRHLSSVEANLTRAQVAPALEKLRSTGGGHFESRWKRKDGTLVEISVSTTYINTEDGGLFQGFLRDIGPEIAARRRIERLNEFYAFLSHANAEIFKRRTIPEILDAVCAGAVSDGKFRLVWAGRMDENEQRIVPDVIHGEAGDYARGLVLTMAPGLPTSNGPTHRCLVEQRVVYTDDFQHAPTTAYWHDRAMKHELRSQASAPIIVSGKSVAALVFYSGELSYFSAELRALIEEVAKNVSLAWQSIELEAARENAVAEKLESESRFRRIFEASPLPMHIISLANRGTRAINNAHQDTFGYRLDEIPTEERWFASAYPDLPYRQKMHDQWEASLGRATREGANSPIESPEILIRCKNGRSRWVVGYLSVVGDDIVLQWQDITDTKASEAKLSENERRFRSMIEQTITGVYVVQEDRIAYVNPRMEEILGWDRDYLVGKNPFDFMAPNQIHHATALAGQIEAGAIGAAASLPVVRKDGRVIELGVHATASEWDGRPAVTVLAQDITEHKQAEEKIAAYVKQLEGTMQGTLEAVARMVDMRDPYTAGHERRVGLVAADIAREMGWDEARCKNMELMGLVHDIGKIAVPAEILSKPTRLTPLEYQIVQGHAEKGYEILKDVEFPLPIAEIIREHHERLDGSGYPQGLKGDAILPEARVLAVADVLESMSAHRPYRPALGIEIAVKEIVSHRGVWFDNQVVDAMLRLVQDKGYKLPD